MSDILEALRKVELQRSNAKVPGISTRQRYYTAQGQRIWSHLRLIVVAALLGASLSGAVAAYLAHEEKAGLTAAADAAPAQSTPAAAPPPVQSDVKNARLGAAHNERAAPHPVSLQTSHTAPRRLPGPRHHAVDQRPANNVETAQSARPAEIRPIEEVPEPVPEEKAVPETNQPASPKTERDTSVASRNSAQLVSDQASDQASEKDSPVQTAAVSGRSAYNHIPNPAAALDKIRPPMAVEVKPYRPNDVLRPPVSRKNTSDAQPPLLTTLSSQYQSRVPKMVINAQVYSATPSQRFVVINMKRYNEGQSTAEGVTVESIRQDDIIFAYQGQRFRMSR